MTGEVGTNRKQSARQLLRDSLQLGWGAGYRTLVCRYILSALSKCFEHCMKSCRSCSSRPFIFYLCSVRKAYKRDVTSASTARYIRSHVATVTSQVSCSALPPGSPRLHSLVCWLAPSLSVSIYSLHSAILKWSFRLIDHDQVRAMFHSWAYVFKIQNFLHGLQSGPDVLEGRCSGRGIGGCCPPPPPPPPHPATRTGLQLIASMTCIIGGDKNIVIVKVRRPRLLFSVKRFVDPASIVTNRIMLACKILMKYWYRYYSV